MYTIEDISTDSSQSFLLAKIHKENYPVYISLNIYHYLFLMICIYLFLITV